MAQVRFQARWFLLTCSLVVLVALRHQKVVLTVYVATVVCGLLAYAWIVPRWVARAERRFSVDALRLLSQGRPDDVFALAQGQRLLRRFGRPHLVPDLLGMAASAGGDHEAARRAFLEALRHAPPEERTRIEVNLAAEELATERVESAEGRYRALLDRRPELAPALVNLGRLLLRTGDDHVEAASYLRRAVDVCDPREVPALRGDLAEALLRSEHPDWRDALEEARAAGTDPARLDELRALAEA